MVYKPSYIEKKPIVVLVWKYRAIIFAWTPNISIPIKSIKKNVVYNITVM